MSFEKDFCVYSDYSYCSIYVESAIMVIVNSVEYASRLNLFRSLRYNKNRFFIKILLARRERLCFKVPI